MLRRRWPYLTGTLILAALTWAAWPGRTTYTISPETTYITEPLDANGLPDYATALNRKLSANITPDENANVLIWRAVGPRPDGKEIVAEYFTWLGIDPPPHGDAYFVGRKRYFDENHKPEPTAEGMNDWDAPARWEALVDLARGWPWRPSEYREVIAWLKRNEKPLAIVSTASMRPKYFNPVVASALNPNFPSRFESQTSTALLFREVGIALCVRAMLRAGSGDRDGAWADLMVCHRLGRLVGRGTTLIESLVGLAVETVAMNAESVLIGHTPPTPKQAIAWLAAYRTMLPRPTLADTFDLGERYFGLDIHLGFARARSLEMAARVETGESISSEPSAWKTACRMSIDCDQSLRYINAFFDECVAALRLQDGVNRRSELARIYSEADAKQAIAKEQFKAGRLFTSRQNLGRQVGEILVGRSVSAFEKLTTANDRVEQQTRNLEVALALAAYRAEHNAYPANLEALAPKYFASVPDDLFSSKSLIYRPEKDGYLLYSVGPNGLDEGGRWFDDVPAGDDPRVRMPAVRPIVKKRAE